MVLSFLRKKDIWTEVGGVEGYITAVKQLGADCSQLDGNSSGYTRADSIWGRLAESTQILKPNSCETRKWLYTMWHENRRNVRTTFLSTQADGLPSNNLNQLSNTHETDIRSHTEEMPPNVSLGTIPTIEPKFMRSKDKITKRYVYHFTMDYDQWRAFYDHKNGDVHNGWGDKLIPHLTRLGITCVVIFRYHHSRLKYSRKKNSNLFSARGYCKFEKCRVEIDIDVAEPPKQKGRPCVFKVVVIGGKNHDSEQKPVARPLTGAAREAMAKEVQRIGALAVYERNLRCANEDLLKEGNFSEVPSIDVLKTAKQQYDMNYRFDEDYFKELRMFGYFARYTDRTSEDVTGFVQTCAEWPFTVHFFTEVQLDRFATYCKSEKYSVLHIDATGSVVRNMKDQKDTFFYCMVFQDKNSSILPLSGALLCDHTAASITSYFNHLRSKLATRTKTARPSFVVIDFSAALINSVLASFNVENIHNYLRRCYNTIKRVYKTKQLRNMTFIRLCCSHAMKAFSRGLFKLNVSKETHHHLMALFAILLNTTELEGAFVLYAQIIHIYGNPYSDNSADALASLLGRSDLSEFDIEPFLEENNIQDDKPIKQDFLDETDVTTDPIIHQSPFNVKACADIPALRRIIKKEKLAQEPSNPLYSTKIIHLLHKWFAYIPFWSGIMTDFFERYAKDKRPVSTSSLEFGRGRLSNATVETYFRTIKSSILEHHTNLRPNQFLMRSYMHIIARFKGDHFGVSQSSHGRKKRGGKVNDLNVKDRWQRRARPNTKKENRGFYFSDEISETAACKLSKGKMLKKVIGFDDNPSPPKTPEPSTHEPKTFDDGQSDSSINSNIDCSIGFSVMPSTSPKITTENDGSSKMNSSSSSSSDYLNESPKRCSNSSDNIFSTLLAATQPHLVRALSPKRSHLPSPSSVGLNEVLDESSDLFDNIFSVLLTTTEPRSARTFSPKRSHPSSDSNSSISEEQTSKKSRQKKIKSSLLNTNDSRKFLSIKDHRTVTVGNLKLTWPSYGIENASYAGQRFSIFHTCSIDTGIFILYHAYKAGTDDFRNLFASDALAVYPFLRRTFQLVETMGWTIARLYWLTEKKLLTNKTKNGKYDLKNTMEAIVFQFIKPMQTHPIKSKCSCTSCPKPLREYTNVHITLTRVHQRLIDFIPAFVTARGPPCRTDLGITEPLDYPADYSIDDKFPVVNAETNVTRIEKHYICEAARIVEITRFIYKPPFVVIDTGTDPSLMIDLPDPLYIGEYTYRLSAGINNTNEHFTAIIKSNNNIYYHFDDTHRLGCIIHNGRQLVELAIYVLEPYVY